MGLTALHSTSGCGVVVIGPLGVGKRTFGQELLRRAGRPVLRLDQDTAELELRDDADRADGDGETSRPILVFDENTGIDPQPGVIEAVERRQASLLLVTRSLDELAAPFRERAIDGRLAVLSLHPFTPDELDAFLTPRVHRHLSAAEVDAVHRWTAGIPALATQMVTLVEQEVIPLPAHSQHFDSIDMAAAMGILADWQRASAHRMLSVSEEETLRMVALSEPVPATLLLQLGVTTPLPTLERNGLVRSERTPAEPLVPLYAISAPILSVALRATMTQADIEASFSTLHRLAASRQDARGLLPYLEWAVHRGKPVPRRLLVSGAHESNLLMDLQRALFLANAALDPTTAVPAGEDTDPVVVASAHLERSAAERLLHQPAVALADAECAAATLTEHRADPHALRCWCEAKVTWSETLAYNFGRNTEGIAALNTTSEDVSRTLPRSPATVSAREYLENERIRLLAYAGRLKECRDTAAEMGRLGMPLNDRSRPAVAFALTLSGRPIAAKELTEGRRIRSGTALRWAREERDAAAAYARFWARGMTAAQVQALSARRQHESSFLYRFDPVLGDVLLARIALWEGRGMEALRHATLAVEALGDHQTPWFSEFAVATAIQVASATGRREQVARFERLLRERERLEPTMTSSLSRYALLESARSRGADPADVRQRALLNAAEAERRDERGVEALFLLSGLRTGDAACTRQLVDIAPHVEGVWFGDLFPRFAKALLDEDPAGLLDAAEEAGSLGGVLVALDMVTLAEERAHRHGAKHLCDRATRVRRRLASLTTGLTIERDPLSTEGTSLTAREREIQRLVAAGRTSQEIADILHLSTRTVEGHRYRIGKKIGASDS